MVTFPVKPVTVALPESRAVILILNGVPAVWVAMFPPPAASTRKFVTRLLKVAVTDCAPGAMLKLQGEFVPVHGVTPDVNPDVARVQPANVESVPAVLASVPTSLLPSDVMQGLGVPEHVAFLLLS